MELSFHHLLTLNMNHSFTYPFFTYTFKYFVAIFFVDTKIVSHLIHIILYHGCIDVSHIKYVNIQRVTVITRLCFFNVRNHEWHPIGRRLGQPLWCVSCSEDVILIVSRSLQRRMLERVIVASGCVCVDTNG